MEYWHEMVTERSWKLLQELRGKFRFVLIGGWAVYLHAKTQKSKDIDVIVDIGTLQQIKSRYDLRKNDNLKKYEIKVNEVDVDIYVPFYSRLAIPLEKVEAQRIEGFDVAKTEELLILKQGAEIARRHSEKGEKDRIDVMSLLMNCEIDWGRYKEILAASRQEGMIKELLELVKNFKDYNYFRMLPSQFKRKKLELIGRIRKS